MGLLTANQQILEQYGNKRLTFPLYNSSYKWDFFVAEISEPILGADFFAKNNCLVDCKNKGILKRNENIFKARCLDRKQERLLQQ